MTESSNPGAGDSPAEAKTGASTNAGSETSASLHLARVGSLRVGEPLASPAPEVAAPTSEETN
ncbi:hypothetical protein [Variovorax sp. W6]|uniref:hypothetical protein n=1 Tax=Variovorax sp. W6 TaxID=3093895 RepID=UPI003D80A21E